VTVINDAYNANPTSVTAALKALAAAGRGGGRTVAVLGEMARRSCSHGLLPDRMSLAWPPDPTD